MKNQVIKVLNKEHGKKVIEYWQSRGIHTSYTGTSVGDYYGVVNGSFVIKDSQDYLEDIELIELPTMNTITTVSRKALQEIYPHVCNDWQSIISKVINTDLFADEFKIEADLIKKAHSEATKVSQKYWLDKYLPLTKEPVNYDKLKTGSVVKLKHTGEHCYGGNNVDFENTFVLLLKDCDRFLCQSGRLYFSDGNHSNAYYNTFIQGENLIHYSSRKNNSYITEVISY